MKEAAAALQFGTAALFGLVRKVTADKVLERLKGEGGTVLKTSLDHAKEAALPAALAGARAVPFPPQRHERIALRSSDERAVTTAKQVRQCN